MKINGTKFQLVPASKQPQKLYDIYLTLYVVLDSWWWTEKPSETCRVLFQNKVNLRIVHMFGSTMEKVYWMIINVNQTISNHIYGRYDKQ
jgi:hypothetical protein